MSASCFNRSGKVQVRFNSTTLRLLTTAWLCVIATIARGQTTRSATTSGDTSGSALLENAKAALAAGRHKEAKELFTNAVALNPKDHVALHGTGIAYLYLNDSRQANKVLEQAIGFAPVVDRALTYNFAVSDMNLGKYQRAAQTIRDYLYANSNTFDEPLLDALGACLHQTGSKASVSRVSDDVRKFYSVCVGRFEEKRPGMKRWGTKWVTAAEADALADDLRKAETELGLLNRDLTACMLRVDQYRRELQAAKHGKGIRSARDAERLLNREEEQLVEKQQKYERSLAEIEGIRPAFPQLLLPMPLDATTPPPFPSEVAKTSHTKSDSSEAPQVTANEQDWVGEWRGTTRIENPGDGAGVVLVRVVRTQSGLEMQEPATGFRSVSARHDGNLLMFRWSNHDQIMVFQLAPNRNTTLACYPSAGIADYDRSEVPSVKPHWKVGVARADASAPEPSALAGGNAPPQGEPRRQAQNGNAPPEATVSPDPLPDAPAVAAQSVRVVTVDAKEGGDSTRVQLGPVRKGQTVTFEYVRGAWTAWPRAQEGSPDDTPPAHHNVLPLRFCEQQGGSVIELGTVPGGTKRKPFVFSADHDIENLVLNMNDSSPHNNKGAVVYKVTIK